MNSSYESYPGMQCDRNTFVLQVNDRTRQKALCKFFEFDRFQICFDLFEMRGKDGRKDGHKDNQSI